MFLVSYFSSKHLPKLVFCTFENLGLRGRKILAASIDIEIEHRHCRLKWFRLTPTTLLSRLFERQRDLSRTCRLENIVFEIHCVAGLHNVLRPAIHGLFVRLRPFTVSN